MKFNPFVKSLSPKQKVGAATWINGLQDYQLTNTLPEIEKIIGCISDCITLRAQNRAASRYIVECSNKNIAANYQKLLDNPNPIQTRFEFAAVTSEHWDITGNAILAKVRDSNGKIKELYHLPSLWFEVLREFGTGLLPTQYRWPDSRSSMLPSEVIHMKRASMKTAPYKGRGVLQDMQLTTRIYEQILNFDYNFFLNDAMPNMAVEYPEGTFLTQEQVNQVNSSWQSRNGTRTRKSNVAHIMEGGKIHNLSHTPRELDYVGSKNSVKEDIRDAYGVPRILLGDTDNVNFNNGQTAMLIFIQQHIVNYHRTIMDTLEKELSKESKTEIKLTLEQNPLQDLWTLLNGQTEHQLSVR